MCFVAHTEVPICEMFSRRRDIVRTVPRLRCATFEATILRSRDVLRHDFQEIHTRCALVIEMRAPNDDKTKKTQGPTKQRSMCLVVQSEVLMREMFNCSHLKSQRDVFGSPSNGRSGRASAMLATSALQCLIRWLCFLLKNKRNFVHGCQIVAQLR